MRPYDTKTFRQVCEQKSDNQNAGNYWIMADGTTITLAEQKLGEPCTGSLTIPRKEFNKLIDWYMRDQKTTKREQAA